jgi:hypothetical protein
MIMPARSATLKRAAIDAEPRPYEFPHILRTFL